MAIRIETEEQYTYLYTPYNPEFVSKIKRIGGAKWSSGNKAWRIPVDCIDEARDIIRDVYGYTDEEDVKRLKIKVVIDKGHYISEGRGPVMMFGKTIASAFGRDSGAKVGDEVSFLEGEPASGGSMKNWNTHISGPAVFTIRNVPETKYLEEKDSWEKDNEGEEGIHLIVLKEKESDEPKPAPAEHKPFCTIVINVREAGNAEMAKQLTSEAIIKAVRDINHDAKDFCVEIRTEDGCVVK